MDIEVLVSTMDLQNQEKLINKMNIKRNLIINQVKEKILNDVESGENRLYSYHEKGLSKSRNRAIEHSNAEICVIADDDIRYEDNYEKIIEEGYKKYPDADIIAFHVENVDKKMEKARRREGKQNFFTSMKIQSVQTTFKRKSVLNKKIRFDENIGAGTELYSGEENVFLADCIKKGLKIYYIPKKIATIVDNDSSWLSGHGERYFQAKGATFYRISKVLCPILILQYAFRKYKKYKKETNIYKAINYMFKGVKKYKKITKKYIYFMGDFCSNSGPAIVNKNYYPFMKEISYICKTNSKLIRPIHFIFNIWKCNVLLISGLSKFHLTAAKIAKKINKKVVYLMHGYNNIEQNFNGKKVLKSKLCLFENELLKKVDKVICVSERFCEYMKKTRKDIDNKFVFVNNGIEIFRQIYKNEKNSSDIYTVISVGGGRKVKNNLVVCKAIEEIKNLKIKFVIIGKLGEDGEKIKNYKFVEYYESLPHEKILKKMEEADLYIQNSYYETFGLAIVEAISMGCDILLSKNVGVLSIMDDVDENVIIQDNENIEEVKSKIEEMLKNETKKCYIKDVNKCTWEEASRKLIKLL